MADKIVQPKVLASTNPDTYDNLIIAQAQNATNATTATNATNGILKADGTYTGFTLDSNGVLKIGDIIIPQKKVLWSGQMALNDVGQVSIPISNATNYVGKKLNVIFDFPNDVGFPNAKISVSFIIKEASTGEEFYGINYKSFQARFTITATLSQNHIIFMFNLYSNLNNIQFYEVSEIIE